MGQRSEKSHEGKESVWRKQGISSYAARPLRLEPVIVLGMPSSALRDGGEDGPVAPEELPWSIMLNNPSSASGGSSSSYDSGSLNIQLKELAQCWRFTGITP